MVKLHVNWKYEFLRPSNDEVTTHYNKKFHPSVYIKLMAAAAASSEAGPSSA